MRCTSAVPEPLHPPSDSLEAEKNCRVSVKILEIADLLSGWVNVKVKTEELASSEDGGAVHCLL